MRTPKWWRRICVCKISNFVKWCCPSKSNGWCCSRGSSATCSRSPRQINPSSKRGWILLSSSHLGLACSLLMPWIARQNIHLTRLVSSKTVPPPVPRPSNYRSVHPFGQFAGSARSKLWPEVTSNKNLFCRI